ncbi:Putative uncharacterized protein [Escherichia coli D6-117.29]|nr:Putative uncharacterized protein [Escherichia coli D6-117.29]
MKLDWRQQACSDWG